MKNCPFCTEEIQSEAIVCKHCGKDLNEPKPNVKVRNPGRNAIIATVALIITFVLAAAEFGGALVGIMGWVAIIMYIVAVVQKVRNNKEQKHIIE